ncbi:MAG: bifunctional riboflavin kinase/FAD synthetase [Syntrophomonadaceae bacterium]|nr:bifunctional riboflavin kinase/FAD synthetase [Syntrophomonadaceae bacterium]
MKKPIVLALGNFDGVHKGHQHLISEAIKEARAGGGSSVVMIFDPHPRKVLSQESPPLLTTIEQKANILAEMGLDYLVLTPFTREVASWSPEYFVDHIILGTFNASAVYVGYNYFFGRGASGDARLLQQLGEQKGFAVRIIEPVKVCGQVVSSTLVRKCLEEGDVEAVYAFTGRLPMFSGKVQRGEGRDIKFPTANLDFDPEMARPGRGVYAARAIVDGKPHNAVVNIGQKPTFHQEYPVVAEAHILDFDGNLYDKEIAVMLVKKLRDERKFPSKEELIQQIERDIQNAREVLSRQS